MIARGRPDARRRRHFGLDVLLVAGGALGGAPRRRSSARGSRSRRRRSFLVAAAVASDVFPGSRVSIETVERVATVALIVILFDGGSSIGWRRFRASAVPDRLARRARHVRDRRARRRSFAHWALGLGWIDVGPARRGGRARPTRR